MLSQVLFVLTLSMMSFAMGGGAATLSSGQLKCLCLCVCEDWQFCPSCTFPNPQTCTHPRAWQETLTRDTRIKCQTYLGDIRTLFSKFSSPFHSLKSLHPISRTGCMVNGLHLYRAFLTSGHSKRFTISPNIHPFMHSFTH